jgi:hypothetical protein
MKRFLLVLAMALLLLIPGQGVVFAGSGDGPPNCVCGKLFDDDGDWICRPCIYPVTIVAGRVVCAEDGSPVQGEPVEIKRILFPFINHVVLTGEKGYFWDFVMAGVFKVTVREDSRLTAGLPYIPEWSVPCQDNTTTSTTSQPHTTTSITGTTTTRPTTTTPTTSVVVTTSTSLVPFTSTTTSFDIITTTSTTTSVKEDKKKCAWICKAKCNRPPLSLGIKNIFKVMKDNNECFQDCMRQCQDENHGRIDE